MPAIAMGDGAEGSDLGAQTSPQGFRVKNRLIRLRTQLSGFTFRLQVGPIDKMPVSVVAPPLHNPPTTYRTDPPSPPFSPFASYLIYL